MRTILYATLLTALGAASICAQTPVHPRDKQIHDADTLAWWHTTEALSNDGMEGRDTGTAAYQRAADLVAARFKAAGLQPTGDNGSYFQSVPMHQVDVVPQGTSFVVERKDGAVPIEFLKELTIGASANLPPDFSGAMTFRGYCGKESMADIVGKVVVCFGTKRQGLPSAGERAANARAGQAAGLINVDDPYFSIEPPRWPAAYARSVTLSESLAGKLIEPGVFLARPGEKTYTLPVATMTLSAEAFTKLLEGSGQDAAVVLKAGGTKQPLTSFEIPGTFIAKLHIITQNEIASPNILAVLPGSDAKFKDQYVVIAAHLDGYGFGTPVNGDNLYNGALDDTAYVALLIQMADDIKAGKLPAPKRSILFAAFCGEEKGLLGSNFFVKHPTIAQEKLVADVNLDQLRPLFPLHILTAEALTDTTLGDTARAVGKPMGIEIRPDMEPERGLLRRADQYPFLAIGVPAISFIFGYDPGTNAEKRYREWYQVRYHRPQDDLTQPMDFDAATKFDTFFYNLVEAIANDPKRPEFLSGSQFVAKP
jgi:hypothetical protein